MMVNNSNSDMVQRLKNENKKNMVVEGILSAVEKNPEVLNTLTVPQLKFINNHYDQKIQLANENIIRIQSEIAEIQKKIDLVQGEINSKKN